MAVRTPQGRAPPPEVLKEASATVTTLCWEACAGSGASGSSAGSVEVDSGRCAGVSGTVGGWVCAKAEIADSSSPVVSNRRIPMLPSRVHSIVRRSLWLLLPLLDVKFDQCIDDELVDDEADRGTANGTAEGFGYFLEGGVLRWIVGNREGGAGGVAGEEGEVRCVMAAVGAGDDGARGGVDGSLKNGMTPAHHVVTRVFVKQGGEEGVGEDAFG